MTGSRIVRAGSSDVWWSAQLNAPVHGIQRGQEQGHGEWIRMLHVQATGTDRQVHTLSAGVENLDGPDLDAREETMWQMVEKGLIAQMRSDRVWE